MSCRQLQLFVPNSLKEAQESWLEKPEILHSVRQKVTGGYLATVYVESNQVQAASDSAQTVLNKDPEAWFAVLPVEVLLPRRQPEEKNTEDNEGKRFLGTTREALYEQVSKGAEVNPSFLMLVVFSTIVAAIGLLENNVAVVIGAMVIAPLLGPNLALALATALGDITLMRKALIANISGVTLCLLLAVLLGVVWPGPLDSSELLSRTDVGFDGIALAIVSGAAAVLSLTSGVSSVLVGVMVAVALLPPAVTFGIMFGAGEWQLALGAFMLLSVNIVCVNISAKLVFFVRGVKPRTWWQQRKAGNALKVSLLFWMVTLAILALLIYFKASLGVGISLLPGV